MSSSSPGSSLIAPWLAAAAVVAFLAGIGITLAIPADEDGSDGARTPPCGAGYSEHPAGHCVADRQVCHAWLDGAASQAVECTVTSPEGLGDLEIDLAGQGRARVIVTDEGGSALTDASSSIPWTDTFEPRGTPGEWTLEVRFSNAVGHGTVTLWG